MPRPPHTTAVAVHRFAQMWVNLSGNVSRPDGPAYIDTFAAPRLCYSEFDWVWGGHRWRMVGPTDRHITGDRDNDQRIDYIEWQKRGHKGVRKRTLKRSCRIVR